MSALPFPAGGESSGIRLLPPRIRYAEGDAHARLTRRAGAAWEDRADNTWVFDDGLLRMELLLLPETLPASTHVKISSLARDDVRIALCALPMELESTEPPKFLDACYRWRTLESSAQVNDFGHLVVRWNAPGGGPIELRTSRGSTSGRVYRSGGKSVVEIVIDAAALHPRWQFTGGGKVSSACVPWTGARSIDLSLALVRDPTTAPPVAARFPAGAEAGFVLTDHCDFDDNELLRAFLRDEGRGGGWLDHGLRLTKGVFMVPSSPAPHEPVPTLADEGYRRLVEELREDGSEIAPHALSEKGTMSGADFRSALERFVRSWSPATWIDHGKTIPYCYTMGGADNPEYRLLELLRELGISTLWSYHDTPVHGSAGLNLLAAPRSQKISMGSRFTGHAARGEFLIALHYGRSLLTSTFRGRWGEAAAQAMSAARGFFSGVAGGGHFRDELRHAGERVTRSMRQRPGATAASYEEPYTREELLAMGAVVYPERAVPLHQAGASDILLFTTMEAVHTRDMYSPGAIERLILERGLHVGHSYLLNRLPYIAGIFDRATATLSGSWRGFIGHLADRVRSGRLWNPTAGELAGWMRERELVSLSQSAAAEVLVENPLPKPVRGYTLLLPRHTSPSGVRWDGQPPSGWRQWDDWLAVWGDLPSRGSVRVRWGGGA